MESFQNVLYKINGADSLSNGFIYPAKRCVNYGFNNCSSFDLMQQNLNSNINHQQVNAYQAPKNQLIPQATRFNYQGSSVKNNVLYRKPTNANSKILCTRRRGDLIPNTRIYRKFCFSLYVFLMVSVNNI